MSRLNHFEATVVCGKGNDLYDEVWKDVSNNSKNDTTSSRQGKESTRL